MPVSVVPPHPLTELPAARPLIAPSLLSCDFSRLADEIGRVEAAGADLLHLDVMDGRFVPNITIGPLIVEAAARVSRLPLDVHLMIVEPERYVEAFAHAGAAVLTVHQEASPHLHRTVQAIRALGVRPGVSINPATPVAALDDILAEVDLVLVMSVNPGFGGQRFIPSALRRVAALADTRARLGLSDLVIEVDGGVTTENAGALVAAGADILVAGSAVFRADDIPATIGRMRAAGIDARGTIT